MELDHGRWLLLIHQIPRKPDYLRVKIWRRLQRLGAVPVKNSVYVLPKSEQAQEDFQWVLREIVESRGDASVCEARFVDGLSDDQLEEFFREVREEDYQQVADEGRRLLAALPSKSKTRDERRKKIAGELLRLKRRLEEISAVDFFAAPGKQGAEQILSQLEARLEDSPSMTKTRAAIPRATLQGRTWVTRTGIHVDRMASAWLVRRFVDAQARFKFVPAKGYVARPGEVRFDMYEAEFTHEGDLCTFEVLLGKLGLSDPALHAIAEIVHDIDLKDSKFAREETPGIDRLIAGIAMAHREDESRLARASAMFDDLYEYLKRNRK